MKGPLIFQLVLIAISFGCQPATKTTTQVDPQKVSSPATGTSITEKYWKLVELNGKSIPAIMEQGREAHIILKADHRVTGHSGCNSFGGGFEILEGSKIKFSKMMSTMMACADVPYEREYLGVFDEIITFVVQGNTLVFNNSAMNPIARFEMVDGK